MVPRVFTKTQKKVLPLEAANLALHYFRKLKETANQEKKTWIVKKILGHAKNAKTGKLEWKIKWNELDNVTWESISSSIPNGLPEI